MTHEFHYDSDLIGGSLQVRESRIIADLLLTQANEESWKQAILTDNILQKRSPATATRASRALRSRLERVERKRPAIPSGSSQSSSPIVSTYF